MQIVRKFVKGEVLANIGKYFLLKNVWKTLGTEIFWGEFWANFEKNISKYLTRIF